MSPTNAKVFAGMLSKAIARWEEGFGPMPSDETLLGGGVSRGNGGGEDAGGGNGAGMARGSRRERGTCTANHLPTGHHA
jgi:hypothetical protein